VPQFDLGNTSLDEVEGVVHGSALLVKTFLQIADTHHLKTSNYLHFVTSSDARGQLPPGSRYHQINSPTPDDVRLAIQGEPSVKD